MTPLLFNPGATSAELADTESSLASDIADVAVDTSKIDDVATDGLSGVVDSLSYRVEEIERHIHNQEYWYGRDAGVTELAIKSGLTAWQVIAGTSEAYGAWVQITDGTQFTDGVYFDAHRIVVTASSANSVLYYIQLGTGESGAQVAKTTVAFMPQTNLIDTGPTEMIMHRELNTAKLWARCKCVTDSATLDLVLGVHAYEG